jgi:hypothetical protein
VHAQLAEGRRVAAAQHGDRVFVVAHRQQGREVAHVLLELVEHRGDPPLAEPDAGPHALLLELERTGVGGLLEEGHPGLAPQFLAEQER